MKYLSTHMRSSNYAKEFALQRTNCTFARAPLSLNCEVVTGYFYGNKPYRMLSLH